MKMDVKSLVSKMFPKKHLYMLRIKEPVEKGETYIQILKKWKCPGQPRNLQVNSHFVLFPSSLDEAVLNKFVHAVYLFSPPTLNSTHPM